jgi:ElaB/YqjD/DUF883 family membrane-anchored ribosome-binding protein
MIDRPYSEKKDLHIGGTVPRAAVPAAGGIDALASEMKNALLSADDFVRSNPWQTLAVVAVLSLAAGYGLAAIFGSRR